MNDGIYVAHEASGEVHRWDSYALHGRGMPNGYREASHIEIRLFQEREEMLRRWQKGVDALEHVYRMERRREETNVESLFHAVRLLAESIVGEETAQRIKQEVSQD